MAPKIKYINCFSCGKKARTVCKSVIVVSENKESAVFYNYFVCTGKTMEEIEDLKKKKKISELARSRGCGGKMLMDHAESRFYNTGEGFDRFISKLKDEKFNEVLYESDIKSNPSYFLNKGSTKRILA